MDFVMMQAVYYRTVELSQIEVAVLFALAGAAKDSKTNPSPSLNTIAHRTALCRRSVSRGIKSLEAKGIIAVRKRATEHGKLCNEYCVDCTTLKASVPNDCKSNVDYESNYNKSLNMSLNNTNYVICSKTQGGLEGDAEEESKPKEKTHARKTEPRNLEEIFAVLRKEFKQEYPGMGKYIDRIVSTEFHGGELPEKLLKELREQELKGWPGIRLPLSLVRSRLRGYVPYSLKGILKRDLEWYRGEREEAMKDFDCAKRCKDNTRIRSLHERIAEVEGKIEKTERRILEIDGQIKSSKINRRNAAR